MLEAKSNLENGKVIFKVQKQKLSVIENNFKSLIKCKVEF